MTDNDPTDAGANPDDSEQKRLALTLVLDAWEAGLKQGVEPELLASTAIYAALSDMIDLYGEEPVAQMVEGLPDRIRNGEFTLNKDGATQ